jgi:hypothetical protein
MSGWGRDWRLDLLLLVKAFKDALGQIGRLLAAEDLIQERIDN